MSERKHQEWGVVPPLVIPNELERKLAAISDKVSELTGEKLGEFSKQLEGNISKLLLAFERLLERKNAQTRRCMDNSHRISELLEAIRRLEEDIARKEKQQERQTKEFAEHQTKFENFKTNAKKTETHMARTIKYQEDEIGRLKRLHATAMSELKKKEEDAREVRDALVTKLHQKGVVYKNEVKMHRMIPNKIEDPNLNATKELHQLMLNREQDLIYELQTSLQIYHTTMDLLVKKLSEVNQPLLPIMRLLEPNHMKLPAQYLREQLDNFIQNFSIFIDAVVQHVQRPKVAATPIAQEAPQPNSNDAVYRTYAHYQSTLLGILARDASTCPAAEGFSARLQEFRDTNQRNETQQVEDFNRQGVELAKLIAKHRASSLQKLHEDDAKLVQICTEFQQGVERFDSMLGRKKRDGEKMENE